MQSFELLPDILFKLNQYMETFNVSPHPIRQFSRLACQLPHYTESRHLQVLRGTNARNPFRAECQADGGGLYPDFGRVQHNPGQCCNKHPTVPLHSTTDPDPPFLDPLYWPDQADEMWSAHLLPLGK